MQDQYQKKSVKRKITISVQTSMHLRLSLLNLIHLTHLIINKQRNFRQKYAYAYFLAGITLFIENAYARFVSSYDILYEQSGSTLSI